MPGCGYTCDNNEKASIPGVSSHPRERFPGGTSQLRRRYSAHTGKRLEIVFADNDAVNQSTQLVTAIQSRVESRPDAIVVEPVGGTGLPQVARAASAAGIGWAVLNRRPTYLSDLCATARVPITSRSDAFKENNSRRCCPEAVTFCTLRDLRRVPQPRNVRAGCRRRNRRTYK
jgi:hypothetical protein